ncbi:hypothetical protein SATMO3_39600 [Sporomusa aerivorans]
MESIRKWAYQQMISLDTGEQWTPFTWLMFLIIFLGVIIDLIS